MTLDALKARLGEIYNAGAENILPVRGALHAKELAMRLVAREGGREIAGEAGAEFEKLASIYGLTRTSSARIAVRRFDEAGVGAGLTIVDESEIEYSDRTSLAGTADDIAVIRSLEGVYGGDDEPCAAIIASPDLIARFSSVLEPNAVPAIIVGAALSSLAPHRFAVVRSKIESVRLERRRLAGLLAASPEIAAARECERAFVRVIPRDVRKFLADVRALKIEAARDQDDGFLIRVGDPAESALLLSAFGVNGPSRRIGEMRRETLETKISAWVDLDQEGVIEISTGVGFFDHMLTQVACHAGVSATVACDGDLEVDAHHTIEDCAIAFGQALAKALGGRRGLARFGFVLPMDEAEAKVSIDLGGRPFLVFNGDFKAPLLGEYPTEMTEHVFRSLSQALGASIHVSVTGDNDHHKTEACFKAFGRALRQAIQIEGTTIPSTKGIL